MGREETKKVVDRRHNSVHLICMATESLSDDERANIAAARFTLHHRGRDLPVTNIFDSEGVETQCVRDAFRCVAYDAARPGDKWVVIYYLNPGDLVERTS